MLLITPDGYLFYFMRVRGAKPWSALALGLFLAERGYPFCVNV